jgi:hypothetical protein
MAVGQEFGTQKSVHGSDYSTPPYAHLESQANMTLLIWVMCMCAANRFRKV